MMAPLSAYLRTVTYMADLPDFCFFPAGGRCAAARGTVNDPGVPTLEPTSSFTHSALLAAQAR